MDQVVVGLSNGKIKASAFLGGPRGSNSWEAWFLDHVPLVMGHGRAEALRLLTEAVEAAKLPPEQQTRATCPGGEKSAEQPGLRGPATGACDGEGGGSESTDAGQSCLRSRRRRRGGASRAFGTIAGPES